MVMHQYNSSNMRICLLPLKWEYYLYLVSGDHCCSLLDQIVILLLLCGSYTNQKTHLNLFCFFHFIHHYDFCWLFFGIILHKHKKVFFSSFSLFPSCTSNPKKLIVFSFPIFHENGQVY